MSVAGPLDRCVLPGEPTCSGSWVSNPLAMIGPTPLHGEVSTGSPSLLLVPVIVVAAVGAAVLLGLAMGAFVQRQSRPYLLIVAALTALLARSAVAGFTLTGVFSPTDHHLLEHGLDVVLVALVIAAVYYSRTVSRQYGVDP